MRLVEEVVGSEEVQGLGLRHAALGAATSSVLHGLKNATTVIHAGAQLLQQALSPADQALVLADLRGAAGEAEQLIRALSRIARLDVPRALVDVTALVEQVALAVRRLAHVSLDVDVVPLPLACVPEVVLARALAAALVGARGAVVLFARGEGHERVVLEVRGEVVAGPELLEATRALEAAGATLTVAPECVRLELPAFSLSLRSGERVGVRGRTSAE